MQMLKDFGWDYFTQCFGWLYLRKTANSVEKEQDGELFSDNALRAELVNHVVLGYYFTIRFMKRDKTTKTSF